MLKIGFFKDFKGADSVLLHGSPEDMVELSLRLEHFVSSAEALLPIHPAASISERHPVELFASRSSQSSGSGYHWPCPANAFETIQGKLEPLTKEGALGHQYFELTEPGVQLVVSVGEYNGEWWQSMDKQTDAANHRPAGGRS